MQLGLIGQSLKHSFSKKYFEEKFEKEGLSDYSYENFELPEIDAIQSLLSIRPNLRGFNVTIPYKEAIISYLNDMSNTAREIGAVNTVVVKNDSLKGYNTDVYGFSESLKKLLQPHHKKALILGTGGASRAVAFSLKMLGIAYLKVSREPEGDEIGYEAASRLLDQYFLVVNTTPLGTYPNTSEMPPLILDNVSKNHLFYDLVYNPPQTALLRQAAGMGAQIKNGNEMLELQAERSWQIWHEE